MNENRDTSKYAQLLSDMVRYFEKKYPGYDLRLVEQHQDLQEGLLTDAKEKRIPNITVKLMDQIDFALRKEAENYLYLRDTSLADLVG